MKYFFLSLIFFFSLSFNVFAGEIYFESKNKIQVGESISLPIYLNTNGENVNSIDVEIYFNKELFTFEGYKESTFKNWIIPPKVEDNKIYFTGIIPGGVSGVYDPNRKDLAPIPVISLSFRAKSSGQASFIFVKNEVLKNDGLGSLLEVTKKDLNILITDNIDNTKITENIIIDNKPPLPFNISLIEDTETGKLLVFKTIDLESGISFYKIKRGSKWDNIESPYKLEKPFFSKILNIRAYDFNNNYSASSINIQGYFNKYIFYFILFIFASILVRKLIK